MIGVELATRRGVVVLLPLMKSLLFSRVFSAALGGFLLVAGAAGAQAQLVMPAASPKAALQQRVGITDIEITYSRPSAKGREIFGGLVAYDEVWRAGADAATKVTFSTPVVFGDTEVPAGAYALFAIPGKDTWTLILNEGSEQWGSYQYDAAKDVARAVVRPTVQEPAVETFVIEIGDITVSAATLNLAWDTVRVTVPLKVDTVGMLAPQIEGLMASDAEKKPYPAAAMFYFESGHDLEKAEAWMSQAVAAQPNAFWFSYRLGLIRAALGDKAGAKVAAEASLVAVEKASGAVKEEYRRLNQALLAQLEG